MDEARPKQYITTLDQFVQQVATTLNDPRVFNEFAPLAKTFGLYAKKSVRAEFPLAVWDHPNGDETYNASVQDNKLLGKDHQWNMTLSGVVIPEGVTDAETIRRSYVPILLVSDMKWGLFRSHLQADLLAVDNSYGGGDPFFSEYSVRGVSLSFDYRKPVEIAHLRRRDSERGLPENISIPSSKMWFLSLIPQIETEVKKREQALAVNQ